MSDFNYKIKPIPGAQITSASVEPWLEKCVKISHVGPEITFDIDVDLKSAREECLFSVTDLGNFHEIAIDFEYTYDFAGAPDLNFTSSVKKDIVCQQSKFKYFCISRGVYHYLLK